MAVRETLELDIEQALQDVEKLGTALDGVAVDFKVGLADAISILNDATVAVDVTTTVDTTGIDEAIASVDEAQAAAQDFGAALVDALSVQVGDAGAAFTEIGSEAEAAATSVDTVAESTEKAGEALNNVREGASSAAGSLTDISTAGNIASGELESVGGITTILGEGLAGTTEKASELATTFGAELGPEAEALVGTLAGLGVAAGVFGAVTDKIVQSATELQSAEARLNITSKGQSEEFQNVSLAGLGVLDTQQKLAGALGSTAASVDAVNAKQASLIGQSTTLTDAQKKQFEANLSLVSANAVVTGAQSDYSTALDGSIKGLANYQRAGLAYNATLSKQDVEQTQARLGIDGTFSSLDRITKSFIVSEAAVAKYGDSFRTNVAQANDISALSFKNISTEFQNFLGEIGQPIISPALDLIKSAEPIGRDFAEVFASLAQVALPAISSILSAVEPLIKIFTDDFSAAIKQLSPEFSQFASEIADQLADPEVSKSLIDIAKALSEVLVDAAPLIPILGEGLGGALKSAADLAPVLEGSLHSVDATLEHTFDLLRLLGLVAPEVPMEKFGKSVDHAAGGIGALIPGLDAMKTKQKEVGDEVEATAEKTEVSANSINFLTLNIEELRFKSDKELKAVSDSLGLNADDFKKWSKETTDFVDALVKSTESALPKIADAFQFKGTQLSDPSTIEFQLKNQQKSVEDFTTNIETLHERGLDRLVAQLLSQGPIVGGGLAKALVNGAPATTQALEDQLKNTTASFDALTEYVQTTFGPQFATATGFAAKTGANIFGESFKSELQAGLTTPPSILEIIENNLRADIVVREAALVVGRSIGDGLIEGIQEKNKQIEVSVTAAALTAAAAARAALGVHSPSTVFAEIGRQTMAGMALGFQDSAHLVIAEAEKITQDAAATTAAGVLNIPVDGSGQRSLGRLDLHVGVEITGSGATPAMVPALADAIAGKITPALASQINAQVAAS